MTTDKYSVIMPTYNEKDNLPIITFLLFEQAKLQYSLFYPVLTI